MSAADGLGPELWRAFADAVADMQAVVIGNMNLW